MTLSIPVRFADGAGNVPAAANWNDDNDWLMAIASGVGFVSNGGMESWAGGTTFTNPADGAALADSWTLAKSGTSPATADVTREASVVDSGSYSMKVNITGAGSSDSAWQIIQTLPSPTSFGSSTIIAGAKMKVATASVARVRVDDGSVTAFSSYHTGDGTWQLLQAKLATVVTPSRIRLTIDIIPINFTGAVYIDSIYVYIVPAAISARAQAALVYTPLAQLLSTTSGDITISGSGKGLVVTTPDGTHTYRLAISNTGVLTTELVT